MLLLLLIVIYAVKMDEIVPLESFIRDFNGPESDHIIADMSRADSLFKLEDTRDLVFAMLHYRFHLLEEVVFLPINLLQYGCQCQIMTDASLGVAKDPLDESCVGWHQCRTCIKMSKDLLIEDQHCDPVHSMYQIGVNTTDQALSCELAETDCQRVTCGCDLNLVNNFMKHLNSYNHNRASHLYDHRNECRHNNNRNKERIEDTSYKTIDQQYVSKISETLIRVEHTETIDQDRRRPIKATSNTPNDVAENDQQIFSNTKLSFNHNSGSYDICCGDFPNIRPYSSNDGKRKCCGSTVYDWKKRECCPHATITPVGTC